MTLILLTICVLFVVCGLCVLAAVDYSRKPERIPDERSRETTVQLRRTTVANVLEASMEFKINGDVSPADFHQSSALQKAASALQFDSRTEEFSIHAVRFEERKSIQCSPATTHIIIVPAEEARNFTGTLVKIVRAHHSYKVMLRPWKRCLVIEMGQVLV